MKDSAGLAILAMAAPIFLAIIMFGTLANAQHSANSTKDVEITRVQNNTNNKNDKQDF